MRWVIVASLFGAVGGQVLDELLSARCQAKCLHDFEQAAKEKGLRRRTLKHTIIPLCKSDINCSSCAAPCREPFHTVVKCKRLTCKDSSSRPDCIRSCRFLNEIYNRKDGSCPRQDPLKEASECVGLCRRDIDCGSGEKCCEAGCGRACLPLVLPKRRPGHWLPIPALVSVKERKRGRSAKLRWDLPGMTGEQERTHSHLFVIQWRWGLKEDASDMNAWQTVAVRNKRYAIIKHLLSPGRVYLFRIASVNLNGTLGFSEPSPFFRLSKSPKAPGAPLNLSPGKAVLLSSGLVRQEISWLPPPSDLPILHYQVTWAQAAHSEGPQSSALVQADAPREKLLASDNEVGDGEENEEDLVSFHKSTLLPSDENRVELLDLRPGTRYIVEVHAIVGAEREEIDGEKATLVLEPKVPAVAIPTPTADVRPSTAPLVLDGLAVRKPFYETASLKAQLRWKAEMNSELMPEFAISWWPLHCTGASYPSYSLDKPSSALSRGRSFQLYDLKFGCQYKATVAAIEPGGEIPRTLARESVGFETPLCPDTDARDESLFCPELPAATPGPPSGLRCGAKRLSKGLVTGHCFWDPSSSQDVNSYRVVIGAMRDGVLDRDTVLIKIVKGRRVGLESLEAGARYRVEVEALNTVGPSASAFLLFDAPPDSTSSPAPPPWDWEARLADGVDGILLHSTDPDERAGEGVSSASSLSLSWTLLLLLLPVLLQI